MYIPVRSLRVTQYRQHNLLLCRPFFTINPLTGQHTTKITKKGVSKINETEFCGLLQYCANVSGHHVC